MINPQKIGLKTWIEIDVQAVKHNYGVFRRLLGKNCLMMAVVKSNAYGHGIIEYSKLLQKFGVNWFGVDNIEEALSLRKEGIKNPILILGHTPSQNFKEAIENNISVTVSNFATIEALKKFAKSKNNKKRKIKIHLKIDTGMHRQGFLISDLPKLAAFSNSWLSDSQLLEIEGIFTHFSSAGDTNRSQATLKQIEEFNKSLKFLETKNIKPKIRHCANTAAAILFKKSHFDLTRIGIGLYGLHPSQDFLQILENREIKLKPALSWKTIISEIKNLPKGNKIGYDLTEMLKKNTKAAILPIGYWHGLPRALSRIGYVLINGKKAKILGNVSMDITSVDISGINAKVGDTAIIIGKNGKAEISADEIANLARTINYEIVTRINPLIKRICL